MQGLSNLYLITVSVTNDVIMTSSKLMIQDVKSCINADPKDYLSKAWSNKSLSITIPEITSIKIYDVIMT